MKPPLSYYGAPSNTDVLRNGYSVIHLPFLEEQLYKKQEQQPKW